MTTNIAHYSKPAVALVLLLTCTLAVQAAVPSGWLLAGSKPASYEVGVDAQAALNGHPSAYLKANEAITDGFGTLMPGSLQRIRKIRRSGGLGRFLDARGQGQGFRCFRQYARSGDQRNHRLAKV